MGDPGDEGVDTSEDKLVDRDMMDRRFCVRGGSDEVMTGGGRNCGNCCEIVERSRRKVIMSGSVLGKGFGTLDVDMVVVCDVGMVCMQT